MSTPPPHNNNSLPSSLHFELSQLLSTTNATISPQGHLLIPLSPHLSYTITDVHEWEHVSLLTQFWHTHETTFKMYLYFCYAHTVPISLVSIFLCGLDLHTLQAARTTYYSLEPSYSFLNSWVRQIIVYGQHASCSTTHQHHTITIRHNRMYIVSHHHPVTYYYPLHEQQLSSILIHKTPFVISHSDIQTLQQAWITHHQLKDTLKRLATKKPHHKRLPTTLPPNPTPFPSNCIFAKIWPFPIRPSTPKEFDSTCWCFELPLPTSSIVVRLQSLTLPTLTYLSQIDHMNYFDPHAIHQQLTEIWTQSQYQLLHLLDSSKPHYITPQFLEQWCQSTFGISIFSTLEHTDPLKQELQQRYNSLFNIAVGTILYHHNSSPNIQWCKKTSTLQLLQYKIHANISWMEWSSIPYIKEQLSYSESQSLFDLLHNSSIPE